MADDEYEMEWDEGDDNEGWGDDNEPQADDNDPNVQIQNNFYEGEGLRVSNPDTALANFEKVIQLEKDNGKFEYTFNSIKYMITISMQVGGDQNYEKMINNTKLLLDMSSKVSRNDTTDAINAIQDGIQNHLS